MTFAQALARIEELWSPKHHTTDEQYAELQQILCQHADSIVQLAKVAERLYEFIHYTQLYDNSIEDYDKLMKRE